MNWYELKYREIFGLNSDELNDLTNIIKYSKSFNLSIDKMKIGRLVKKKFGKVKEYQFKHFSFTDFETIAKDFEFEFDKNMLLLHVVQSFNYIVKELKELTENENRKLSSKTKYNVDTSKLEQLQWYWQLTELSGFDITKHESILQMPYDECFLMLYAKKIHGDYLESVKNEIIRESKNKT